MSYEINSDISEVVALRWDEFLTWFRSKWEPGQHIALVGPTGTGKTTIVSGILPMRKYVVAIDAKGGDSTLHGLLNRGFEATEWPLEKRHRKAIEEGQPVRVIVGSHVKGVEDLPKLRRQVALVLRDSFNEQGWTVYADELQIITDKRLMALGGSVERILIAARDRKVSFVSSFQSPVWVSPAAHRMSTYFFVLYTRDRDTVNRIAEISGRPAAEIRGMVKGLPEFACLVFTRNPRDPVIITKADKVA